MVLTRRDATPAVADGVVYVGCGDNNLYAVDAVTGAVRWRFGTRETVDTAPAVAGGLVCVGSADENAYAVDAVTGSERWRFTTGGRVFSSPLVAHGMVHVGSEDTYLYALDAATGAGPHDAPGRPFRMTRRARPHGPPPHRSAGHTGSPAPLHFT